MVSSARSRGAKEGGGMKKSVKSCGCGKNGFTQLSKTAEQCAFCGVVRSRQVRADTAEMGSEMTWLKQIELRAETERKCKPCDFCGKCECCYFPQYRTDIPRLIDTIREMEAALRFYADRSNYNTPIEDDHWKSIIVDDDGDTARDVLRKFDEGCGD